MKDQKPRRRGDPKRPSPDPDVFRVSMRAPDHATLARAVRELGLDIDHQHPDVEAGTEAVEITGFLTQRQIDELQSRGWALRVEVNLSEIGRERQREVAAGDRFNGGKVKPTGLGKKVRGDK
jgi:hypothetical protein